jgi:RNA polymerase sigma-70 factor (ECF subfamily)
VAGDRAAFAALARPHLDVVYTLCVRMTSNAAEAEDASQEALVRALRQRAAYDPTRAFRPWLLTIAANLCRDRLRSAWWRRVIPLSPGAGPASAGEEDAVDRDRDARVRDALATLPAIYREAVSLFHLDGMTYAEMTEITGVAVPALKQRVRRGLLLLEEAVTRMYPALASGRTRADPG